MPIVSVALLAAAAVYTGSRALEDRRAAHAPYVEGSGTIEATQVQIAGKIAGRVSEVLVDAGDRVRAGQVLVRFDAAELDAQVAQADAGVAAARTRLAQAQAALRAQRTQAAAALAQAEAAAQAAAAQVPQASEALRLQEDQARQQVAQARAAVAAAEAAQAAARATREAVRANLEKGRGDLARAQALFREGAVAAQATDAARATVEALAAQEQAAAAQEAVAAQQVEQARAALALAEAIRRQIAIRRQDVAIAQARQAQAAAAAAGARSGRDLVAQRQQEVAAAQAAVTSAEAALRYTRALRANAVLRSPIDGVVLARAVEPGEVVAAGTSLLSVADLRRVWLRVFVPEAQLGRLRPGAPAQVFVDAFPGRPFAGTVSEIADQAEFTPRNVQTREERVKLVFGVRITLENPAGLLKPGMPADARIALAPLP
ncbi:MAG: efflux RND transporter periplasmic adaptor subunit [Armatimonadota bacterium]|nr:efflux RND transporter periplasmic adaptor subunit [Armatimonadota bacterium]MDR7533218.1 efflux RND transporter periplasmic adaptor subunit [Armatimonadota bacterium]MDR7535394.1 efflux RND transporter periplasmic adaptor subunit [Armatimonadota bacterium]